MYNLAVGAMFKNEEGCMEEWLEHYLARGVEHFYLIDDESTDRSTQILEPYIARGLVTLFKGGFGQFLGRQRAMYNHFILPRLKETQWLLMVDLDEFVWSHVAVDLREVLRQLAHLGQVQIYSAVFGSAGRATQPAEGLVEGFTRRCATIPPTEPRYFKYFVNSDYAFSSLNVHHATFEDVENEKKHFQIIAAPYLQLNHYSCQSREFWDKVKCTRGDSDAYQKRNDGVWALMDQNDVEDVGLRDQTRALHLTIR